MAKQNKTLHLMLKRKWWDMIPSGEKKEEYRDANGKKNKTLHLMLKRKWWNMIASGEKKEEYRDANHYWAIRLLDNQYKWYSENIEYPNTFIDWLCFGLEHHDIAFRDFENVCFHLGYTNNTMTFKITSMNVMYGEVCRQEWGAETNKYYFVISLGERIK